MNIKAGSIANISFGQHDALPKSITRGESAFARLMVRGASPQETRATLREAAEQIVSTVFVTPILGAMRENSTATGPFAPGVAEKRFGPLLDQQFADRIVRGANFSLVDTIVDRYLPKDSPEPRMLERTFA